MQVGILHCVAVGALLLRVKAEFASLSWELRQEKTLQPCLSITFLSNCQNNTPHRVLRTTTYCATWQKNAGTLQAPAPYHTTSKNMHTPARVHLIQLALLLSCAVKISSRKRASVAYTGHWYASFISALSTVTAFTKMTGIW